MTQAKPRFRNFEDYLDYDDGSDRRYELVDGELVELPPESPENDFLALNLRDLLITLVRRQLIRVHTCEIEVPVLKPREPANRYPDVVILRAEHLDLMGRRLTIKLEMPPPMLIVEVLSPGTESTENYQPQRQTVLVLTLKGNSYQEKSFMGQATIVSSAFPDLELTAEQILNAGQ